MMPGLDVTTIVFAIIAIFVVWKLRSVLGTRSGAERPPFDPARGANLGQNGAPQPMGQVLRMPTAPPAPSRPAAEAPDRWKGYAEPGSKAAAGLDAIAAADPSFAPDSFLSGAKSAYEMIVTAFANGDQATLGNLLAPDVMDNFAKAIDERRARGEKMETDLVSIDSATIDDARLNGAHRAGHRPLRGETRLEHARQSRRGDRRLGARRRRSPRHLDLLARHRLAQSQLAIERHRDRALTAR